MKKKMNKEPRQKIISVSLAIAVITTCWLGYAALSLKSERNSLQQELADLEGRGKQVQKKLAEQKALADHAVHARSGLESEVRAAVAKTAELDKEKQVLQARVEELEKKSAAGNDELQVRLEKLKGNIEQWKDQYEKLRQESVARIKEQEQTIAQLTNDKQQFESSLKQETQQHDRCKKNNAGLAALAQELVDNYRKKGVLGSLAQSEPLTQLKQVELEKLMQEYLDRIDKNTL